MHLIALWLAIAFWVLAIILHWIPDPSPVARLRDSLFILGFVVIALSQTGVFTS